MNTQDSIRIWFQELERRGEYVCLVTERFYESGAPSEPVPLHHADFDGVSALREAERRLGAPPLRWVLPKRSAPPKIAYAIGFIRYLMTVPFWAAKWKIKGVDPETFPRVGVPAERTPSRASTYLNAADTEKMRTSCKARGYGPNAYVLWCLQQALEPFLEDSGKRVWLIPFSLRDQFEGDLPKGNHAGFFDLFLNKNDSAKDVHAQWKKKVFRGDGLGGYVGLSLGRVLGEKLLRKFVGWNDLLQVRTGVFSNLGSGEGVPEGSYIVGFPPVIKAQPVAALAGIYGGRQVLSLQFHPRLSESPEFAEKVIADWRRRLLE